MKTATSPSNLHSRCGGRLTGFLALALAALLGTAAAPAQTVSPASHPSTPAASARPQAAAVPARHGEEEETEAKPNDASHQGIKIHGHWKIDIKNPDGSLASTHEFENSLQDGGLLFSYLLGSRATSGEAAIALNAPTTGGYICGSSFSCLISETSTGYWATASYFCTNHPAACSPTLNLQVIPFYTASTPVSATVVLSGSAVASSNATLSSVATYFAMCSSASGFATVTPSQCHSGTVPTGTYVNELPSNYGVAGEAGVGALTSTVVSNISVLAGQTVQVTVTLSFS